MATKNTYFKGGAEMSWQRRNPDGTFQVQKPLFPIVSIEIETAVEWVEAYNYSACIALLALRIPGKTGMTFNFKTESFKPQTFALGWMGIEIAETQVADTAVPLSIDAGLVEQGGIIDIKTFNVEDLVVAGTGGTPEYILGVDYAFNAARGYVIPLADGGIADNTPLDLVMGTVPAESYTTVATMKDLTLEGRFVIDTASQVANNFRMIIKRATIASEGSFAVIGDEVAGMEFSGSAVVDVDTITGTYSDYLDIVEMNNASCDKIA